VLRNDVRFHFKPIIGAGIPGSALPAALPSVLVILQPVPAPDHHPGLPHACTPLTADPGTAPPVSDPEVARVLEAQLWGVQMPDRQGEGDDDEMWPRRHLGRGGDGGK
jgi:hypothetical protein